MIPFLRANIGLLVWLIIFAGGGLILAFTAYLMRARGVSLKPIWWFAGFMLLIGFPQLIYHAIVAISSDVSGGAESAPNFRITDPESLFTATPEGATVVDVQPQMTSGLLATAEKGRFITLQNQDTRIIAQFTSEAAA